MNPPSSLYPSLLLLPTHSLYLNKEGKQHDMKQDLCLKFYTWGEKKSLQDHKWKLTEISLLNVKMSSSKIPIYCFILAVRKNKVRPFERKAEVVVLFFFLSYFKIFYPMATWYCMEKPDFLFNMAGQHRV